MTSMMTALVVTDDADQAQLAEAIGHLKAKHDRRPLLTPLGGSQPGRGCP